jgi:hypothetical protein
MPSHEAKHELITVKPRYKNPVDKNT